MNTSNSNISQPNAYKTIEVNGLKITFLGLVETNGKDDDIIPSTHPWRVKNLTSLRLFLSAAAISSVFPVLCPLAFTFSFEIPL